MERSQNNKKSKNICRQNGWMILILHAYSSQKALYSDLPVKKWPYQKFQSRSWYSFGTTQVSGMAQ